MSEQIIPGVSFNEISEGLIGTPAPGAFGVLLVGTACKGPLTPQFFGSDQLPDLLDMYGPPDPYQYKAPTGAEPKAELTLSRAAVELYTGGPPPGGVWCVRVAETGVVTGAGNGITLSHYDTIRGGTPVSSATVTTANWVIAGNPAGHTGIAAGDRIVLSSALQPTLDGVYWIKAVNGTTSIEVYPVGDDNGFSVGATDVAYSAYGPTADGNIRFTAKYSGQWYNNAQFEFVPFQNTLGQEHGAVDVLRIKLPSNEFYDSYIDSGSSTGLRSLNRFYGNTEELQFNELGSLTRVAKAAILTAIQANVTISKYWDVTITGSSGTAVFVDASTGFENITLNGDTGGRNWSSNDSAIVVATAIKSALAQLLVKPGRCLVIGGCDESVLSGTYITEGINHVKAASVVGADNERIFVFGTGNYDTEAELVAAFEASPYPSGEERIAHITPGIVSSNRYYGKIYSNNGVADINTTVSLSGGYAAARVAGIIASYAPDDTILNKSIGVTALEYEFGRSTLKRALNKRFTVLAKGFDGSFVVRRALTSAPDGNAFAQISTRLAVDEIRYAVRLAMMPFIGKKNTARVRKVMAEKLATVMNKYVNREIINEGFEASVTATRDQEIIGELTVDLTFQVVFYIEFIKVNLLLQ